MSDNFWETKKIEELSEQEWEQLCDGCGKCCFEKFIEEDGKEERLYFTRLACPHLNLENFQCTCYKERFEKNPECTKMTASDVAQFKDWLPRTCAYRLLAQNDPLPSWHPLITGKTFSAREAGACILNPVHSAGQENWDDFIIEE